MSSLLHFPIRVMFLAVGVTVLLALAACEEPGSTIAPTALTATLPATALPAPATTAATALAPAFATSPSAPSPLPTLTPCVGITVSEPLRLSDVPGAVRVPLALAKSGNSVFVAGRASNNLGVVESDTLRRVIPVGDAPTKLAADPASDRLFVMNEADRTIALVEGGQVRATLPISSARLESYQQLSDMVLDAARNRLYAITNAGTSEIFVLDTTAFVVIDRIHLSSWRTTVRLALAPAGDRLYIAGYDRIDVLHLASRTIVQTVPIPFHSYRLLTVDPATGRVFFDQYDNGPFVGVIQDGQVIAQVAVGADPYEAVVVGNRLFVANGYSNTVSVVDTVALTTIATIDVGLGPRAMLADAASGRIYVALEGSYGREVNRLDVIDTTTLTVSRRIPLMAQPSQLISHTAKGRLYALMPSQGALVISDGRRILSTVALERAPMQMALDERTERVYVTDYITNRVTVIDGASGSIVEQRALSMPTRLNAIAVDALNQRLAVNNRLYMLDTLAPAGYFTLTGYTIPYGDGQTPERLIANPQVPRLYAVASNGVPGSNSGSIPYVVDSVALKQIGNAGDRSVSALLLDVTAQKVYAATTHPLAGNTTLQVYDALNFTRIHALPMPLHVTALALSPQTQHLFAVMRNLRWSGQAFVPDDYRLDVLDSRTLGRVTSFRIPAGPIAAAALGDRVFIAHATGNALTVVQDCALAMAAAPTPTPTPSPYPTLPPQPSPSTTATRTPTPLPAPPSPTQAVPCRVPLAPWLQTAYYATFDFRANVGCPTEAPRSIRLAKQSFQNGMMYWREDTRKIYVILNSGGWSVFDDLWDSTQPEGGTERPPSPDLSAPKRGFGKVWREALGGPSAEIGWALTEERGASGESQLFDRGLAFRDDVGATYVLAPSGSWR